MLSESKVRSTKVLFHCTKAKHSALAGSVGVKDEYVGRRHIKGIQVGIGAAAGYIVVKDEYVHSTSTRYFANSTKLVHTCPKQRSSHFMVLARCVLSVRCACADCCRSLPALHLSLHCHSRLRLCVSASLVRLGHGDCIDLSLSLSPPPPLSANARLFRHPCVIRQLDTGDAAAVPQVHADLS